MPSPSPPSPAWIVTDGNVGNLRQAQAMARALGLPTVREWVLEARQPWKWFAPRRVPGAWWSLGPVFAQAMQEQPPALAIGCGRQAALATRLLRDRGATAIQILDPRIATVHWNWVIAPEHDRLMGANVITLSGSLNVVDDAWLAEARSRFATFGLLPGPRTALLLGGDSAHMRWDRSSFESLAARLDAVLERDGGSLLATASRRTPEEIRTLLHRRYAGRPGVVWRDDSDGQNPYPGLLAWADRIVCSPDSVNMLSEACATRVPVHVFDPDRVTGRPRRFLDDLLARGRIRPLEASLPFWQVEPLRETARVAALIRHRLDLA